MFVDAAARDSHSRDSPLFLELPCEDSLLFLQVRWGDSPVCELAAGGLMEVEGIISGFSTIFPRLETGCE